MIEESYDAQNGRSTDFEAEIRFSRTIPHLSSFLNNREGLSSLPYIVLIQSSPNGPFDAKVPGFLILHLKHLVTPFM